MIGYRKCPRCGHFEGEFEFICTVCGDKTVPYEDNSSKKNNKKDGAKGVNIALLLIALASCLVMVLTLLGIVPSIKTPERKIEGTGFDSAEATISAYIEALNNGDIDGMLSTYAIESYVDNFDTQVDILERQGGYYQPFVAYQAAYELSEGEEFDRNIRIKARQAEITRKYYQMLSQYTLHHDGQVIGPLENGDEIKNSKKNPGFLNAWRYMKFITFVDPDELFDEYGSEENQRIIMKHTKAYCCEAIQDVCARVEISGEEYYQFAQCGKYNGKWYIINLHGDLAGRMGVQADLWGLIACSEL